jgi:Amt family ammonium transporter
MKRKAVLLLGAMLAAALVAPQAALAQGDVNITEVIAPLQNGELNVLWVIVAGMVVIFMQAGFAFLEIGFSRGKNVGTGVAKIFVNFAVASIAWWAIGFGIAFGGDGWLAGNSAFFFSSGDLSGGWLPGDAGTAAFLFFQFAFCAVSLAIVWGTTLERIKFAAYGIFAVVFAAIIYPLIAHGVWGGGILAEVGGKPVMDFAGSSVVHLTGATAGLAALLLLGARRGKYGPDGKPRAIPGHSMPFVGLGVLILWLGWFGFNGGSTLGTEGNLFAEVILNTQLAAAAGVIGASLISYLKTKSLDVGMCANGAIAGLVGITAPAGFVEFWAAPVIGFIAGVIVVFSVLLIEKKLDDPVGALSAHGVAGIWGTLAVGIFASPRLILEGANAGIVYGVGDGLAQLGVQALAVLFTFVVVFVLSTIAFAAIKATVGLRVSEEEERAGLDISSHGMYGYPEQFIPQEEYPAPYTPHVAGTPIATPSGNSNANAAAATTSPTA